MVLKSWLLVLLTLLGGVSTGSKASEPQGDFHICYFSLNNEKEVTEMQKFTEKIEKHTHCSISVKEYLTEGDDPEESFKKMVDSGVRCDGLVISGHHTGAFGGKRASSTLGIDFLEKMSCDPKYSKWFNQVNALWLQGCRTLGTGEIVINEDEISADYHTTRVGAVLDEDHLEQSIADLNMEFSATLDQDNPLSSRYLRAFPGATVFGWTKTAPGEKAGSQYSIPFHIAHISKIINNQDAFPSDSPIKGTWTKNSAVQYLNSMIGVLNGEVSTQCKDVLVKAWKDHGKVHNQETEYGFYNPDLNAYKPLQRTEDATLTKARFLDCLLKQSSGEKLLKILDEILKDPKLIRYTYNSILARLQDLQDDDDIPKILSKLKSSQTLKQFLSQKLTGPRLGILRKIDYFAFYEEVYGKNSKLKSQLLDKASQAFENISSNNYNEIDYKITLLNSLTKYDYLNSEQGISLLSKLAKDDNVGIRQTVMSSADYIGEKALPVLEQGVTDQHLSVQLKAVQGLSNIKKKERKVLSLLEQKALPILEQGIKDQNLLVRQETAIIAGKIGEKALPILEQGIKDQDYYVRHHTVRSAGRIGEKALPILEQGIKDQDDYVRLKTAIIAGKVGEKALPILEQGIKDQNLLVRQHTVHSASKIGEKALPILEQGIKDQNVRMRKHTVQSASDIGEKALPILEQGIKDQDPAMKHATLWSASRIGKKALPMLREALKNHEDHKFKEYIEKTINEIIENPKNKKPVAIKQEK